ncbi:hypothetical protein C0Q70_13736 [Pomacea canaliculata]|uniref:Uncharacterized protein n=1 Tax=Pomacea canaliculata TaxID=400727 RepID=A0A2T7NY12_POMCA|nr:hypothetical protein C0Q70_13736 [Pomacea canaliculata]
MLGPRQHELHTDTADISKDNLTFSNIQRSSGEIGGHGEVTGGFLGDEEVGILRPAILCLTAPSAFNKVTRYVCEESVNYHTFANDRRAQDSHGSARGSRYEQLSCRQCLRVTRGVCSVLTAARLQQLRRIEHTSARYL